MGRAVGQGWGAVWGRAVGQGWWADKAGACSRLHAVCKPCGRVHQCYYFTEVLMSRLLCPAWNAAVGVGTVRFLHDAMLSCRLPNHLAACALQALLGEIAAAVERERAMVADAGVPGAVWCAARVFHRVQAG